MLQLASGSVGLPWFVDLEAKDTGLTDRPLQLLGRNRVPMVSYRRVAEVGNCAIRSGDWDPHAFGGVVWSERPGAVKVKTAALIPPSGAGNRYVDQA